MERITNTVTKDTLKVLVEVFARSTGIQGTLLSPSHRKYNGGNTPNRTPTIGSFD